MALDLSRHPCFNDAIRHQYGRLHLPIAPKCNVQCNFCDRQYDCVNESRPGVTSAVLSPQQALRYVEQAVEKDPRIAVVGIAGPGDPFANAPETMETLRLVRAHFPDMILCVASNGLNVAPFAEELAAINVSHVTITVNAVDPEIGKNVYAWIRDGKRPLRGLYGAQVLWEKQQEAIRALKAHDVTVKINSIVIPGVNDDHIVAVAETTAKMGADLCNIIPIYPVENTVFEDVEPPTKSNVELIRAEAAKYIKLMHHCTRCRADAAGLLGEATSESMLKLLQDTSRGPLRPDEDRPYVAAASMEDVLVNRHLGEVDHLTIFRKTSDGYALVEHRAAPSPGSGDQRWQDMATSLGDCRAVLVSSVGEKPRRILTESGVRVVMMEGLIEEGLEAVFEERDVRAPLRRKHQCGSGATCAGDGSGCG